MNVYLAGPITGLTYGESTDWRERFRALVKPGIDCLSPMRGKAYLRDLGPLHQSEYPQHVMSSGRAITTRDFFDCTRSDAIVVNLLGAEKVSIGTVMEMAWAYQARVPVIAVIEDENNIHDHSMIRETIGFRVTTLDMAVHVVNVMLLP